MITNKLLRTVALLCLSSLAHAQVSLPAQNIGPMDPQSIVCNPQSGVSYGKDCTPAQLTAMGVGGMPANVQDYYNYSATFTESNPAIQAIATAAGYTAAQVNSLFILAGTFPAP